MNHPTSMPTTEPAADQRALDEQLGHLRQAISTLSAPASIEAKLASAFGQQQRAAGWQRNVAEWLAPGSAIAVSLAVSVWMLLGTAPVATLNNVTPSKSSLISTDASSPFIALQSLEQIALEPNPRVIETQLPKMMLASLGVSIAPEVAGDTLRAEMLVSAAGQPLAVRLSY
jgi:hypothetical protein